jgi:hypothetical protein
VVSVFEENCRLEQIDSILEQTTAADNYLCLELLLLEKVPPPSFVFLAIFLDLDAHCCASLPKACSV